MHFTGSAGDGQAGFLVELVAFSLRDDRVDEHVQIFYFHDGDAAQHADLGRRDADAVRRAHGLDHVFDQDADAVRYFRNGSRFLLQGRIFIGNDIS